ncbi:MAG: hypothetical protein ACLQD8_02525 [Thermoplasmata archaeon]
MAQQRLVGLRGFVQTPVGRILLLALAIGLVVGAFYITVLLAIPAILIAGLWLPIYFGMKRPRYLALSGLVILLLVAPIVTATFTNELLAPIGAASSSSVGVDWSVTVGNATESSQTSVITFELPSGSQNYTIAPIAGFATTEKGSVVVGTSAVSVPVAFSLVKYAVTFTESGLPSGTSWGVSAGANSTSSVTPTVVLNLPNGSYPYRLASVAGFTPPSPTGNFRVDGAAFGLSVSFNRTAYPITFSETGLPPGTAWSISADSTIATALTRSIVLDLPNGSIPFIARSIPPYGASRGHAVVAGAPGSAAVAFEPILYPVTFSESHLPASTLWTVTIGGVQVHSRSITVGFNLSNGTYGYEIGAPAGYAPLAGSGNVTVDGAPAAASVSFSATPFAVRLTEPGLPTGTPWTVTIDAAIATTTFDTLGFNLTDGTYPYSVGSIPGFTVPSAGSVTVSGAAVAKAVSFAPVKYGVTFTASGLAGSGWNVTLNGVPHSSMGPKIEFNITNGTYTYQVAPPGGKTPPATNASVVVNGRPVAVAVPFASKVYAVTFVESGLPSGAALENASVSPFHGISSTEFTWTVTVAPRYVASTDSSPLWVELYISTCPGATSNASSVCSAGYPFIVLTDYFCTDPSTIATCEASVTPLAQPVTVSFNYTIGSNGIWEWQMGLGVEDLAAHTPTYTLLVGDPQYNGLEGPVVGSFGTIFEVVLPSVYLEDFLYLGAPFYAVLLLYAVFKNRERKREDAKERNAGPIPPTSAAETAASGAPTAATPLGSAPAAKPPSGPGKGELACPNCEAVVYPGEAKCWKCGSSLTGNASAPLPPG